MGTAHHPLLLFRLLCLSVMVEENKRQVPRKLLTGISGYAKAGQLTALMGSSGAGKVTILRPQTFARFSQQISRSPYFS